MGGVVAWAVDVGEDEVFESGDCVCCDLRLKFNLLRYVARVGFVEAPWTCAVGGGVEEDC